MSTSFRRLAALSTDRLVAMLQSVDAELSGQIQDRRTNPTPNSVRAQIISDLSAEQRIYLHELRGRGVDVDAL